MKISPLTAGGNPSANLKSNSNGTVTPQSRAAAIAVLNGTPALSPSEDPQVQRVQNSLDKLSLKMKTNATPGPRDWASEQSAVESAISDPVVQADATTEETKPLSPQFAALAKQRRALQVKERELADREKALTASSSSDGDELKARLKSQPLSVLQEQGLFQDPTFYNQLTEHLLNNPNLLGNPELQALKDEIKALKEGVDKNLSDRDAQAEQQVLAEFRRTIDSLSKDGDAYELVRETGSQSDVVDLIHRTFKQTGEILSEVDALQLVEDELLSESLKIANFKKIQSKLTPAQSQPVQKPQPFKQMKTLTNRDGARNVPDRRSRALAAFSGTLTKE